MKKYVLIAAALVAVLACQKNNESVAVDPDENLPEGTLVPVKFNAKAAAVRTKSIGGLNNSLTADLPLRIYGLVRAQDGSYVMDTPGRDGLLINNVQATSIDLQENQIELYDPAFPGENIPFYYGLTEKYDFFAYYVDDAADPDDAVLDAENGTVSLAVSIDGTQDILWAHADRENDAEGAAVSVSADRLYSAYSARKNINPSLILKHELTRFRFFIDYRGAVDGDITIDSLSLESVKAGVLNIIGGEAVLVPSDQEPERLYLTQAGETENLLVPVVLNTTDYDGIVNAIGESASSAQIGESIMVYPGQGSYEMRFRIRQEGYPNPVFSTETLTIPGGIARAGEAYNVIITVYGLEKIVINVDLEAWDEAGVIEVGQDED